MQQRRGGFFMISPVKLLAALAILLLIIGISLAVFLGQQPRPKNRRAQPLSQPRQGTVQPTTGTPHGQGPQLLDSSGRPLLLRGAQIASPLNFLSGWQTGQDPTQWLNPRTFQTMRSWHMNALRLPVSGWYYRDPRFLPLLDTIIKQANQAGLYVILALFDDIKSGSPYGQGAAMPKAENVTFWKFMAGHFAKNPMLLFDLFNEPTNMNAQNYLTGGGTVTGSTGKTAAIIGLQPLVDAIRSVGAKQTVIASAEIPAQNPTVRIHDPNVMYTVHIYSAVAANNPEVWDQAWGSLLGQYPLYYGEWAALPNSLVPQQCRPYTPANATTLTEAFLHYMEQRQINWTAWQFRPYYLVQDVTSYVPTSFEGAWTPCDTHSHAGMGLVVKEYLLQHNPAALAPSESSVPVSLQRNSILVWKETS